jgi:hypothetical protein
VLDLEGHLGEHNGVVQQRLRGRDDLDAACDRGERGRGRPGFELVARPVVRIDRVLGHENGIVSERLGFPHEAGVALPGGVVGFERIVHGGAVSVNQRPDPETQRRRHPNPLQAIATGGE